MKKTMKKQKQSKRFPSWGLKGLLSVAFSALGIAAFAQGAEVCQGAGYTIADAVSASAGSEYRWLENGNVLTGTNQATYNVPNNKAAGVYTYIRQSKSTECPDWQSSNEFTVTVFDCTFAPPSTVTGTTATFTDPRDGKQYKTVVMPDGRTWFAQNLNYTQGLTYNAYSSEANGKQFTSTANGVPAIGSYWCPGVNGSNYSEGQNMCNIYGALYTWETAMMVDGKYADETKTSSAWEESWLSGNYFTSGSHGLTVNADKNNARGGTDVKGGGRGICPKGWHVPTDREWANLLDSVEGDGTGNAYSVIHTGSGWVIPDDPTKGAGTKLKSSVVSTSVDSMNGGWYNNSVPATDEYGFNVLAPGYRENAICRAIANMTRLATSSAESVTRYWEITFQNTQSGIRRTVMTRTLGISTRCLKD
jgi:uncharacterized protein (TIGR02145 family)